MRLALGLDDPILYHRGGSIIHVACRSLPASPCLMRHRPVLYLCIYLFTYLPHGSGSSQLEVTPDF
jgi:hypothetical protein